MSRLKLKKCVKIKVLKEHILLKIKIIGIIVGSLLVVGYFCFIQIQHINYINKLNSIKKDIVDITTQINNLKEQELLLETDINTNNEELQALKNNLVTLQTNLQTAIEKLNSLN